jgi:hypothetical protein
MMKRNSEYVASLRLMAEGLGTAAESMIAQGIIAQILGPFATDRALVQTIAASTGTEAAAWNVVLRAHADTGIFTAMASYAGPRTVAGFLAVFERQAAAFARTTGRVLAPSRPDEMPLSSRFHRYVGELRALGVVTAVAPPARRNRDTRGGPTAARERSHHDRRGTAAMGAPRRDRAPAPVVRSAMPGEPMQAAERPRSNGPRRNGSAGGHPGKQVPSFVPLSVVKDPRKFLAQHQAKKIRSGVL